MTDEITSQTDSQRPPNFKKKFSLFFTLLLLLIILALGSIAGYLTWHEVQTTLSKQRRDFQHFTSQSRENDQKVEKQIADLTARLQESNDHLIQQKQIIQQMTNIEKGHFDIWRALETAYLVNLANDQIKLTQHTRLILPLLERAIDVLQPVHETDLIKIQQTLRADLIRFKSIPLIDRDTVYTQLIELNSQLDQLVLTPLNQTNEFNPKPAVTNHSLPWWEAGWHQTLNLLKKIIIIHRQTNTTLPFILPQEKNLFYQSLHARMDNAIWGLLHHDATVYEASLDQVISLIQNYADKKNSMTQSILSHLQALKNQPMQPITENLNNTVAEIDRYLATQLAPTSSQAE